MTAGPDDQDLGGDDSADLEGTIAWSELYAEAVQRLATAGVATPAAEARWIVEEASGYEGAEYREGLSTLATVRGVARFDRMLARRADGGEPLQYVLGRWAFRGLDLMVDRRVLIPRPETETVAEAALAQVDRLASTGETAPVRVVDLGTGAGSLALSIASERPNAEVWATDLSTEALAVARANLAGIGRAARRVRLLDGSWFDALPDELAGEVDVIVSNPPYVGEAEELPAEVREWEPHSALVGGPTGLEAVELIVDGAPAWLRSGGALVVELAPHQADDASRLAATAGLVEVEVLPDLSGRSRTLVARAG